MNAHALEVLEFDAVLSAVSALCGSDLGRDALRARRPGTQIEELRHELQKVWETLLLRQGHPDQSPPLPPDARAALRILEREGGVLDAPQVGVLLVLLQGGARLRQLIPSDDRFRALVSLRTCLFDAPREASYLERIVDEHGEIRDDATPELRQIRRSLQGARARIVRRLEALLQTLPDRVRVSDASVSVRDGRFVIPIRREGRSAVGGVIHGESATGATLFVEPPVALRLMAEVSSLERDEERELERILRTVSERMRPLRPELSASFEALIEMDTLWARAAATARWNGAIPELLDPLDEARRGVAIVDGRHPLLLEAAWGRRVGEDDQPVVPFSLELEPHERALVISGPNTGGKTVFLKAMGLLPLLAQSGLIPPVGPGTRLPVLRNVFADIGDEQSIAQSLSTFSAHLVNAREILTGAGPGTLVLMDELGTGTDPTEGAALGRAILETLVENGARAIVTSHLGEMKRLDADGSGIVNASLLFDAGRIRPTYQLQKGRPGRSYGMAIARRLGIPDAVLHRAEGYVDSSELETEALLETLEMKERALAEALDAVSRERDAATALRDALEAREKTLAARERTAEARAREEARQRLLDAREEVEAAIRDVRSADETRRSEAERDARRRVEEAAKRQSPARPDPRSRTTRAAIRMMGRAATGGDLSLTQQALASGVGGISEGDRVRVRGSGAKGVVRELKSGRVVVEVGALRLQLPEEDVERIDALESPRERAARGAGARVTVVERIPKIEVQLLGLRVDEVELALGRALDDAVVGHLPELRIVHGKGTGAVRARVQELLRADPRVETFRGGVQGEGGGGVTVAVLR